MGDTPTPPMGGCIRQMLMMDITSIIYASAECIHRMYPPNASAHRGSGGVPLFKFIAITRFTDEFIINAYDFIGTFISTIFFLTFITYFDVMVAFGARVTIKFNVYFVVVHFNINRCVYLY